MIQKIKKLSNIGDVLINIFLIIAVFLLIRWSNIEIIFGGDFFKNIFVKEGKVDPIILSLITSYVGGYIIYVLTIKIPRHRERRIVIDRVLKVLSKNYYCEVYILLLMSKNACTKDEWKEVVRSVDTECFNDKFFDSIKRLDINGKADTIYKLSQDRGFTWIEFLENNIKNLFDETSKILERYQTKLFDEDIDILMRFVDSKYIEAFMGTGVNLWSELLGEDGYLYYDNCPLRMMLQTKKNQPFFDGGMLELLRDYIDDLIILQGYLIKQIKKNNRCPELDIRYAISKLSNENVGHLNQARLEETGADNGAMHTKLIDKVATVEETIVRQ